MKREEQITVASLKAAEENINQALATLGEYKLFFKAFKLGVIWADEHPASPWISIKERLPEMYEDVVVLNNGKPIMSRRYWVDRWNPTPTTWMWSKSLTNVTHWMPIPELKKGGEK